MSAVAVVVVASVLGAVVGSPVRSYDQRQQGELNIHAQLENIVIVVIPSSSLNLLSLAGKTKYQGDKADLLQLLQKPTKGGIDRYGEEEEEKPAPALGQKHGEKTGDKEKEEEVVATVEEMKPTATEKTTDPPRLEVTEESSTKEHSAVSETVQESVLKISVPEDLREEVAAAEQQVKETNYNKVHEVQKSDQDVVVSVHPVSSSQTEKTSQAQVKPESTTQKKEESPPKVKEESLEKKTSSEEMSLKSDSPVVDLIRPVAAKEEKPASHSATKQTGGEPSPKKTAGLVEGVRKEKVIRYKPETKWAPDLVDLLGPPKQRSREVEVERQRFSGLCSPGRWDPELRTCIMPGDTRSRTELARFLEAMRFGIAVPSQ